MQRGEQPRSSLAMLLGSLAVVLVVASVIGTLAATGRFGGADSGASGGILGAPAAISTVRTAQLLCPSGAAFSSDGAELAVIGSTRSCHAAPYGLSSVNGHVLALFDAHLGTLQRTIPLDPLLGLDPYAPRAAQRIAAVRYVGLGWAPGSKKFAVAYTTFDSATAISFEHVIGSGLLLIDTTSGTAAVIRGDAGFFSPTGTASAYPVWNLDRLTVSPPAASGAGLTYSWSANGAIVPVTPLDGRPLSQLPVSAGARYPVGEPDGDSTFTLWQPGVLLGRGIVNAGRRRDTFVTAFPTWSANGAFATLMLAGAAVPASASDTSRADATPPSGSSAPAVPLPASLPLVPARDAALASVTAEIGAAGWALVAWNPAGTLLASINCGDGHGPVLEVRSTATGNVLGTARVPLPAGEPGCRVFDAPETLGVYPAPDELLRWSPDGHTLLVADERASTLSLWRVQDVPAGE